MKEITNNNDTLEKQPLVSIIVITYNSAKYVLETLESAKAQSYRNIELVVSDDCSTDNTVEICRKWIEENSSRFVRTELITVEKNTGIPSNCNRGVKIAHAEWLKILAGDNVLLENCIQDNLFFANRFPDTKFITSNLQILDNNGNSSKIRFKQYDGYRLNYFNKSAKKQLKAYVRLPVFLNSPAFFIKS